MHHDIPPAGAARQVRAFNAGARFAPSRDAAVQHAAAHRPVAALWVMLTCGVALAASLATTRAGAAQGHDAHHGHGTPAIVEAEDGAKLAPSEGEVKRLDVARKRVTIAHGPLENLGMPPMTMAFEVDESAQLEALKVGDRVRFIAGKDGRRYTASEIRVQD